MKIDVIKLPNYSIIINNLMVLRNTVCDQILYSLSSLWTMTQINL